MKGYSFLSVTRNFGNQLSKKAYGDCNKSRAKSCTKNKITSKKIGKN